MYNLRFNFYFTSKCSDIITRLYHKLFAIKSKIKLEILEFSAQKYLDRQKLNKQEIFPLIKYLSLFFQDSLCSPTKLYSCIGNTWNSATCQNVTIKVEQRHLQFIRRILYYRPSFWVIAIAAHSLQILEICRFTTWQ